jgi:hypothetical protein
VQGANVPRSLVVWEDYVVRDFVASVTIDSPDNDGAGILFHFAGPTSYYYCEAHDEENQIRIRSNINGTTTTHAVATWNGTFSSIKTMRVTGSDLLYECSFDGVTVRAVHSRMPVGPVGLIQDHNNGVRFNNFEVDGG